VIATSFITIAAVALVPYKLGSERSTGRTPSRPAAEFTPRRTSPNYSQIRISESLPTFTVGKTAVHDNNLYKPNVIRGEYDISKKVLSPLYSDQ